MSKRTLVYKVPEKKPDHAIKSPDHAEVMLRLARPWQSDGRLYGHRAKDRLPALADGVARHAEASSPSRATGTSTYAE